MAVVSATESSSMIFHMLQTLFFYSRILTLSRKAGDERIRLLKYAGTSIKRFYFKKTLFFLHYKMIYDNNW